ncbi:MAG: phosphatase PAP2 family protein [Terriglobia bacterium]
MVTLLASLLQRSKLFDLAIQSGIRHDVLGGFWFAAALFVFWLQAARGNDPQKRVRILTVLVGSIFTVILTLVASSVISWPQPIRHHDLAGLFPKYIDRNPITNSFPSQSTALYASIAAGVYSLHKVTGTLLWTAVILFVAFPRMYVGGHYLSDVIAGLLLALLGYAIARYGLESRFTTHFDSFFEGSQAGRVARELLVFVWILQVAVEFREAIWVQRALETIVG